ncbi:metallophosphoesterase [Zavarzinia compransoris]|uniref:Calcineurin-like phosphoesterase domain-containing protein n=1 Tax=Zavarzinia compransoris TaxID=1264899 RepID=A0A317E3Y0_9PROT|nr:metallophosphoesterase [Zavarzinia compransoris]PWR21699.1 hypothetical protein DKG75_06790 [Zavarzinia compransoris]TDP45515.1 serine/threonine protein phosphatase 1 [Zavarzinia compransoris]
MTIEVTEHDWRPLPRATGFSGHVIGDIHGLRSALDAALALYARRGGRRLVTLGDYVDRGPDSLGVLDRLIAASGETELIALAGNHEQLMLQSLRRNAIDPLWYQNGGNMVFGPWTDDPLRPPLADLVGPARLAFLEGLGDYHRAGDLVFVHAGLPPAYRDFDAVIGAVTPWAAPGAVPKACPLQWIRHEFLDAGRNPGGVFVVHGHTIHPEVTVRPHRLSIDVGSYTTGRIALVEIDDDRFRHSVIEDPAQPARWRAARR